MIKILSKALKRFIPILLAFVTIVGCSDSGSNPPDPTFKKTILKTQQFIETNMSEAGVVGMSVALVHRDKVVWAQGFGWADRENQISADAETVYNIGSITKAMTATAALRLQDEGRLSLDQPIATYVPEFELKARFANQMQGITMRRLLNYHSGVPGYLDNGLFVEEAWDPALYFQGIIDYLKNDYPTRPPGTFQSYSNAGFVIAGEAVSRVGGANTYGQYLTENLFLPLGMASSAFGPAAEHMAMGYITDNPVPAFPLNGAATGGVSSTVKDMAQFLLMLVNDGQHPNGAKILEPGTCSLLGQGEKTPLDLGCTDNPGLGLDSVAFPGLAYAGRVWVKAGGTINFSSLLYVLPDQQLGLILLTNSDTGELFNYVVGRECLQSALQEGYSIEPQIPDPPVFESEDDPAFIAGRYARTSGFDIVNDNGDGTLTWLKGAQSQSPTEVVLEYADGGWVDPNRTMRLAFTNVEWTGEKHFIMIQVGSGGAASVDLTLGSPYYGVSGDKFIPPSIPSAWQARFGTRFIVDNIAWNDLNWSSPVFEIKEKDGIPLAIFKNEWMVLLPESDDLAFVAGLKNANDSSVRFIDDQGVSKFLFNGYRGYDINLVPEIHEGDSVPGQVEFHDTNWYRFRRDVGGQSVTFKIDGLDPNYRLRLFDESLTMAVEMGAGQLSWTSEEGTWYLAVSPAPDTPTDYTLIVE